jgi:hypothetical protein
MAAIGDSIRGLGVTILVTDSYANISPDFVFNIFNLGSLNNLIAIRQIIKDSINITIANSKKIIGKNNINYNNTNLNNYLNYNSLTNLVNFNFNFDFIILGS